VVRELLELLKTEKRALDWHHHQHSKAVARTFIEQVLDKRPPAYGDDFWQQKCELTLQHVFMPIPAKAGAFMPVHS
jgi:hypothetical protein